MDISTIGIVVIGILSVVNLNSLIILTWQWEQSKLNIDLLKLTVDQLMLSNERYSVQIRTLENMAGLWPSDDGRDDIGM